MTKSFLTAAASHVVSEFPLTIKKITGEKTTAVDVYLQIHQAGTSELVSGTSVPIATRTMYAADRFEWDLGPDGIDLTRCIIVTSSTLHVFTTSTEVCTLTVLGDELASFGANTPYTVVGDLVTADSVLEIASTGGYDVYWIEMKYVAASVEKDANNYVYLQLHEEGESAVEDGDTPALCARALATTNGTLRLTFCPDGKRYTGSLTAALSLSAATLLKPTSADTGVYIKVVGNTF